VSRVAIFPVGLIFLASACLGCGAGSGPSGTPDAATQTAPSSPPQTTDDAAGLTVVSGTGELGDADYGEIRSTQFVVRNQSRRTLTLFPAERSCECAGVEVKPATVAPGDTAVITIRWQPKLDQTLADYVRVRAVVQAQEDDRLRVPLEARGRIRPTLMLNLPDGRLDFGRLLLSDVKAGRKDLSVEVFTQLPEKRNFSLQVRSPSPGLQVTEPQPLPESRLQSQRAVAGYRFQVRPTEALPSGAFREAVQLQSDAYPDRQLEIVVEGVIENGAVGLSRDRIDLPARIPLSRGYICPPLEIELRGEPGRSLRIARVDPPFLQASLEAVPGKENLWRLQVRIPGGETELRKTLSADQLSDYLSFGFGSGAIVLESDHSRVPVLRIPVSPSQFQR
jgi:hypothetical protein